MILFDLPDCECIQKFDSGLLLPQLQYCMMYRSQCFAGTLADTVPMGTDTTRCNQQSAVWCHTINNTLPCCQK